MNIDPTSFIKQVIKSSFIDDKSKKLEYDQKITNNDVDKNNNNENINKGTFQLFGGEYFSQNENENIDDLEKNTHYENFSNYSNIPPFNKRTIYIPIKSLNANKTKGGNCSSCLLQRPTSLFGNNSFGGTCSTCSFGGDLTNDKNKNDKINDVNNNPSNETIFNDENGFDRFEDFDLPGGDPTNRVIENMKNLKNSKNENTNFIRKVMIKLNTEYIENKLSLLELYFIAKRIRSIIENKLLCNDFEFDDFGPKKIMFIDKSINEIINNEKLVEKMALYVFLNLKRFPEIKYIKKKKFLNLLPLNY